MVRQKTLCTDSFPDDGDMLLSEVAGTDPPDLSPSRPLGETETAFFHSIFQIFEIIFRFRFPGLFDALINSKTSDIESRGKEDEFNFEIRSIGRQSRPWSFQAGESFMNLRMYELNRRRACLHVIILMIVM